MKQKSIMVKRIGGLLLACAVLLSCTFTAVPVLAGTVTFRLTDGTWTDSTSDDYTSTGSIGDALVVTPPIRTGYTFIQQAFRTIVLCMQNRDSDKSRVRCPCRICSVPDTERSTGPAKA
ncbi:MAG: hypothetical protein IJT41_11845 [Clostridia bacterium]|nr:hypothetical protein [Clostridia bacterium]